MSAKGQNAIVPDWTAIDWDDDLPGYGSIHSNYDGNIPAFSTISSAMGGEQDQEDSGED
ncbi:MAG: hypothetical protein ACK4L7_05245 [Flavobacteriales bacterium]